MKSDTKYYFLCALIILGLLGCQSIINVESLTPPGSVPPVEEVQPSKANQGAIQPPNSTTDPSLLNPAEQQNDPKQIDYYQLVQDFRAIYLEKGKPRLVVYLNKELSDEVREWIAEERLNIESHSEFNESENQQTSMNSTKKSETKDPEQTKAEGTQELQTKSKKTNIWQKEEKSKNKTNELDSNITISKDRNSAIKTERENPDEKWMWAFEEGFIQTFLDNGVHIVDRATILRLSASDSKYNLTNKSNLEIKQNEIDALKNYSDILVELLITIDDSSHHGYAFKATAKDVNSGFILAYTTIKESDISLYTEREVVANEKGYRVEYNNQFPSIPEVSQQLAMEIMRALIAKWTR